MPSASAKLEKQASTESHDPMKNVLSMVEKKVRNLEKRKGRLDNIKMEFDNGKELNEDQMNAIKKYEQVLEILEFSKEMQKSIQLIIQECAKQQKKAAKREQVERQQQELLRIRDVLQLQDLLNNMGTDDVRQDFLSGSQGAVKLNQEDLDRLDELYKLVCPDRDTAKEEFDTMLNAAAEHLVCLLDGKNKELPGGSVTYKSLKELLSKISESNYFSHGAKETQEENAVPIEEEAVTETKDIAPEEFIEVPQEAEVEGGRNFFAGDTAPQSYIDQQPLQEVLHVQGNFNFLQDSQVDVESGRTAPAPLPSYPPSAVHAAHLDPAVVAAQPMAAYHAAAPPGTAEEFDPVGPIPTQTFTNQNYAMMGMAAGSYVTSQPMGMPVPQPMPTQAPARQQEPDKFLAVPEFQGTISSSPAQQPAANTQYQSSDDNEEGAENNFTLQGSRGGFRGNRGNRGPRPTNGYSRSGRGFSNGRGGGYQNNNSSGNYYGGRDNYSSGSSQRRGTGNQNTRAATRGGPNRGGQRGRGGNFRAQQ